MLRRERDADAGVGGQLMAETFEGSPDRAEHPRDEIGDVVAGLTAVWTIANSSPPSLATKSSAPTQRLKLAATDFSSSSPTM